MLFYLIKQNKLPEFKCVLEEETMIKVIVLIGASF